mmetsp:Transcript_89223/g.158178  ORF Transcript_89223/g.158178 Transcript_89223/m.158178 type:complete len:141 (-) Transcript_89223:39-461(-)|eukprot:CAMPEP_0197637846 /NCGR_PEP_ID=MMETSP1338-20131121/12941_1 /TAXON_ID=43686 ORGANISM="Pelagodinium beii, Strain RCC1491" /NCGR_SAMPLE_ID=MMETSP1338 /ASSEMBLY_ACC=CAM_ASM_000754 /LENGTH=140 /DNA_ID=CAMNT_0043210325 /DNA_START=41 /DNA_END=463 /DNA_ORIENTATION=+
MTLDGSGASYLQLGPCDDDCEMERDGKDGPNVFQKLAVGLLCTVLTCYFLPMLSFIPLVIFGGVQLPSPWDPGYNNATGSETYVPSTEMPTGKWYWDLPTVTAVLLFLPIGLLGAAYVVKMRLLERERSEQLMQDLSELS